MIQAAVKATDTIPIVMSATADPITPGYVVSLARPASVALLPRLLVRDRTNCCGEGHQGYDLQLTRYEGAAGAYRAPLHCHTFTAASAPLVPLARVACVRRTTS